MGALNYKALTRAQRFAAVNLLRHIFIRIDSCSAYIRNQCADIPGCFPREVGHIYLSCSAVANHSNPFIRDNRLIQYRFGISLIDIDIVYVYIKVAAVCALAFKDQPKLIHAIFI